MGTFLFSEIASYNKAVYNKMNHVQYIEENRFHSIWWW